ncbi:MAG: multidrug effflux MFS transporter [Pseudomonadota bacterium]
MPSRLHLVALLAGLTAVGPFALQALAPALPAISAGFAVSPAVAQTLLSFSLVAMAVSTLLWGPLSDRYGRKPVLIAAMLVAALGSALAAVAPVFWLAMLGRLMQAAGGIAGMVLARTVAQDLYGRNGSAEVIGQITAAMVVAPMVAPALSGILVETVGWRAIFASVAALALLLVIWTVARLPETAPPAGARGFRDTLAGFRIIAGRRAFWAYAGFAAFSFASFLMFVGAAPYVMRDAFDRGPTDYGLWFMVIAGAYMLSNIVCGPVTRRLGGDVTLALGALIGIGACGLGLVAVLILPPHPAVLFLPSFVYSLGAGLSVPNAMAGAVGAAPERAGAASGLLGFFQFLAGALTTQVGGSIPHGSALPLMAAMGLLLLLGLGVHRLCRASAEAVDLPEGRV